MPFNVAVLEHDVALTKKGGDLFKELLRVYSVAEVDDYFKNGRWNNELMVQDLQMVKLHRREAGAPEPPALEDVVCPELPKETAAPAPQVNHMGMPVLGGAGIRPVMPGMQGAQFMGAGVRPGFPQVQIARPLGPGSVTGPGMVGAAKAPGAPVAGGAVAELRLIALFVAKWKLDPTKAKSALAKITPQRRRYVIQNFKTAVQGAEATTALETYLIECEASGCWDNATGPMAALAAAQQAKAPTVVAKISGVGPAGAGMVRPGMTGPAGVVAGAGVKRPIMAVTNPAAQGLRPAQPRPAVLNPSAARATYGAPPPAATAGGVPKAAGGMPKAKGSLITSLLNKF